ncbi:hypothetical protein DL346_20535 [Paenibacillus montanisoli]|uniref:Uncharacterized protein n=2 Tax=Paenibacillus montanisoli TaxID=2081970 RepID=A0A328TZ95_9BACL|nr:hypothetical protein DL346_20535 [Paenibacillus montanisoli]
MTNTVILFGVIVAVVGVVAYLRVYKNSAWSTTTPSSRPHPTDQANEDLRQSAEESAAAGQSSEDDKN